MNDAIKDDVKDINVDDVELPDNTTPPEQEKKQHKHEVSLTNKELYSLRTSKYELAAKKYKTSYVILNKKTGLIVEMRAASPVHACTMIGWKPKNCKLIKEVIHVDEKVEKVETTSTEKETVNTEKETVNAEINNG